MLPSRALSPPPAVDTLLLQNESQIQGRPRQGRWEGGAGKRTHDKDGIAPHASEGAEQLSEMCWKYPPGSAFSTENHSLINMQQLDVIADALHSEGEGHGGRRAEVTQGRPAIGTADQCLQSEDPNPDKVRFLYRGEHGWKQGC